MRDRLGLYVCPEPECPRMGKDGQSCPTHGEPLVRVVYRREPPRDPRVAGATSKLHDTIEAMEDGPNKTAARKLEKTLNDVGKAFGL